MSTPTTPVRRMEQVLNHPSHKIAGDNFAYPAEEHRDLHLQSTLHPLDRSHLYLK